MTNGELVDGGIIMQTRQTIWNRRGIREEAGCTLDTVDKCNVELADARDLPRFNKVCASYFPGVPAGTLDRAVAADDRRQDSAAVTA